MQLVRLPIPSGAAQVSRHRAQRVSRLLPVFVLLVIVSTVLLVTLPHVMLLSGYLPDRRYLNASSAKIQWTKHALTLAANCTRAQTCTTAAAVTHELITRKLAKVKARTRRVLNIDLGRLIPGPIKSVQWMIASYWRQVNRRRLNLILDYARNFGNRTDVYNESFCDENVQLTALPLCPMEPPHLVGPLLIEKNHSHNSELSEEKLEGLRGSLCPGGWWKPRDCDARHRVAIIIPYRDREEHLVILLAHLHQILQAQQLDYRIFVVEQINNATFNKGILMNAAFKLSSMSFNLFQCYVFHDVDLLPEDDRNMYSCPSQPRHMSVAVDKFNYTLPYSTLVGGVFNIRTEHFLLVNGYSNLYWGWGAEDDDMYERLAGRSLSVLRPPNSVARYTMMKHPGRTVLSWDIRGRLLYTSRQRMRFDGLNSLKFRLVAEKNLPFYTHYVIDVGKNPFAITAHACNERLACDLQAYLPDQKGCFLVSFGTGYSTKRTSPNMYLILVCAWTALSRAGAMVRPEFNHKLSQMAPKSGPSSSTGFTWVPVPTNAAQQNPLMYTYPFGYVTAQDQVDTENSVTQIIADNSRPFDSVQPVASVTSYSYVPNSGAAALTGSDTGQTASSSLSFSAVGLLGFIFFLRLIQDTLAIIRGPNNNHNNNNNNIGDIIGRKSRAANSQMEWMKMMDDMYHFYLQIQEETNAVCRQKSLCQVNTYLAHKYKDAGKKLGFLLSDVVGELPEKNATVGENPEKCLLYSHFCSSNGRTRSRFRF